MSHEVPARAERSMAVEDRVDFWPPGDSFATLGEVRRAAELGLDVAVWDFLEGGAGDERTLTANRDAFGDWVLLPRVLAGNRPPATATSLFGISLAMPLLTAPFGADRLFHPDGHLAVADAVAGAGVAMIVPEVGSHSLEEVAGKAPAAARIFQLHALGDRSEFEQMANRAATAGYRALCVTVDCPTDGWRERNRARRFGLDLDVISGNYRDKDGGAWAVFGPMCQNDQPVWTWDDFARAAGATDLPCIAKGILSARDARAALDAGAAAIYVSNHGGRQLNPAPATLHQLPEIVDEVAGAVPVLFDGGVRRGSDVVIALALGADVVVLGRLIAYGLAAGGREGVANTLRLLEAEIRTTLTLLGIERIDALDRSSVIPRGGRR